MFSTPPGYFKRVLVRQLREASAPSPCSGKKKSFRPHYCNPEALLGEADTHFPGDDHQGKPSSTDCRSHLPPPSPLRTAPRHTDTTEKTKTLPKEKAQGSHLSQVHSEDTADLLEGKDLLLLIPPGALRLPVVLLGLGTGVEAGCGAGGAGGAVVTRVPADESVEEKSAARDCSYTQQPRVLRATNLLAEL